MRARAVILRNISKAVAIGGSAYAGWLFGKIGSKDNPLNNDSNFLHFPVFEKVFAASGIGSVLQTPSVDVLPQPAPNAPRISQIMRYGFPTVNNVRSMDDYILSYDTRNRVPYWVFEHLTPERLNKADDVERSVCVFHEDLSVHEYYRATNNDYKGSGFDRGHLAAAGNHKLCQAYCNQTFLLSNIAPQVGKGFNRDKWNELEKYVRKLARANKNVYVCSGPLYLPRQESDGKLYVHYQVIGHNHVAVPTHFFKVVLSESFHDELELEAFILPNQEISNDISIFFFHVPVEIIERASGFLLFDRINKKLIKKMNGKKQGWF